MEDQLSALYLYSLWVIILLLTLSNIFREEIRSALRLNPQSDRDSLEAMFKIILSQQEVENLFQDVHEIRRDLGYSRRAILQEFSNREHSSISDENTYSASTLSPPVSISLNRANSSLEFQNTKLPPIDMRLYNPYLELVDIYENFISQNWRIIMIFKQTVEALEFAEIMSNSFLCSYDKWDIERGRINISFGDITKYVQYSDIGTNVVPVFKSGTRVSASFELNNFNIFNPEISKIVLVVPGLQTSDSQ